MMINKNQGTISNASTKCNRAISEKGYIKLGTLRYGIRLSNPTHSDRSRLSVNNDNCCDNEDCCCIGKSRNSKSDRPNSNSENSGSVSSLNFIKREISPSVCCFYKSSNTHKNNNIVGEKSELESNKIGYLDNFKNKERSDSEIIKFEKLQNNLSRDREEVNRKNPTTIVQHQTYSNSNLSRCNELNNFSSHNIKRNNDIELFKISDIQSRKKLDGERKVYDFKDKIRKFEYSTYNRQNNKNRYTTAEARAASKTISFQENLCGCVGEENFNIFSSNNRNSRKILLKNNKNDHETFHLKTNFNVIKENIDSKTAGGVVHDPAVFSTESPIYSNVECKNNSKSISDSKNLLKNQRKNVIDENFSESSKLNADYVSTDCSKIGAINMEKQRRHTLDKLFGRKEAKSHENKISKTERLKELTEKLKGHKTSTPSTSSESKLNTQSPPIPPRRTRRELLKHTNSIDAGDNISLCSTSFQNNLDIPPSTSSPESSCYSLPSISVTKQHKSPEEKSSIFNVHSKSFNESLSKLLRPNSSVSNLENIGLNNDHLSTSHKVNSASLKEEELFTKLARPESRTIVGSYIQKNIPFRSASFSQVDYTSGKYGKPDVVNLRDNQSNQSDKLFINFPKTSQSLRSSSPAKIMEHDENPSPLLQIDTDSHELEENKEQNLETIFDMPEQVISTNEENEISPLLEKKLAQINVLQANEMPLETLIEERTPMSASSKIQHDELQTATTCLIPIPVFECIENIGEDFCNTEMNNMTENEVPTTVCAIELKQATQSSAEEISENENIEIIEEHEKQNYLTINPVEVLCPFQMVPEVELNDIAIKLDEDKVQQAKPLQSNNFMLVPQKSEESMEEMEIKITPEIQQVLKEVSRVLRVPDFESNSSVNKLSRSNTTDCENSDSLTQHSDQSDSNVDDTKKNCSTDVATDNEFVEVRKRHSNNENSYQSSGGGIDKPLPSNPEDKRRIDKSKRRKGIYIQWPVEKNNSSEYESVQQAPFKSDWKDANEKFFEDMGDLKTEDTFPIITKPACKTHSLNGPNLQLICKQTDSICSNDTNTPDSDLGFKPCWPKANNRRQSLTYQSSDERDDSAILNVSPSIKPFRNLFLRSESVSDNESDRGERSHSIDRTSASPSPSCYDQDLKRYSKRPLRGPYGQMLEKEMKKPTKMYYDLELNKNASHKKSDCSLNEMKKSHLLVPIHARTLSSPVKLISNFDSTVHHHHKRYPSSVDQSGSENHFKNDKKLSLDSYLTNRCASDEKSNIKRSLDEIQLPSQDSLNRNFVLNTPETPNTRSSGELLLAQLLKGSSEKLLNEQNLNNKKSISASTLKTTGSGGIALPAAVLKYLDTRTHIVVELFNTEKNYVDSLQTVVMKYLNPLKMPENSGIIDAQIVDEIFFMVPSILAIHQKLLEELGKRLETWDAAQKVGDIFFDEFSKSTVLETYSSFVNNCSKAKDLLRNAKTTRPSFAKFLDSTAREHKGKLTLDNLLIKPVQKFPQYELIFQRLIKHTDSDHPDQKPLQNALKLVHDTLLHLNCKEREAWENEQREAILKDLEGVIEGVSDLAISDRVFLHFELVSMPSGQATRKERGLFLFNDLIVLTSVKKRSGTIRKPNIISGSIVSTFDTNKYKFLTKFSLDDLEIVKSKDDNVLRIMKEIENLTEDLGKLQKISDIVSELRCSHSLLEDTVKDLQRDVQRQLSERQSNDSQLNLLELTLNTPNGVQGMSIVFSKPERRTQWEELFTDAKHKLAASVERQKAPIFLAPVPIRKTRAGLQFTCASPTSEDVQKDVWVCNSDGYVGQVCVLSLTNEAEPTVTSCNGVCNARIFCIISVPGFKSQTISSNLCSNDLIEDAIEKSSSSSESECEENTKKHQLDQISDPNESQSTMWLGTEDGCILVYNSTDNIRIKKNKIKIQHVSAVYSLLYLNHRVFVSLANGDICVYERSNNAWNTQSPLILSIGTVSSPVTKLLNVHGKTVWCAILGMIKILNTSSLQVDNEVSISNESKPITNMVVLNNFVWISIQNSANIKCCHAFDFEVIFEVNLAPSVNKMLSNCDDIIRQHKAACLRITSLLACKDSIWVGTSAGVLLTIMAQNVCKGAPSPVVTGIPHGHTGHVRFLTAVDIDESSLKSSLANSKTTTGSSLLIISGGDGYEDFRNSGGTGGSESAGREDSTNHLLLWTI